VRGCGRSRLTLTLPAAVTAPDGRLLLDEGPPGADAWPASLASSVVLPTPAPPMTSPCSGCKLASSRQLIRNSTLLLLLYHVSTMQLSYSCADFKLC